jgi:hypothetical protein
LKGGSNAAGSRVYGSSRRSELVTLKREKRHPHGIASASTQPTKLAGVCGKALRNYWLPIQHHKHLKSAGKLVRMALIVMPRLDLISANIQRCSTTLRQYRLPSRHTRT